MPRTDRDRHLRPPDRRLDTLGHAVTLARETGDRWALRLALTTHGRVLNDLGRPDEAITAHQEALALSRELRNQHLEAEVLNDLAAAATARTPRT